MPWTHQWKQISMRKDETMSQSIVVKGISIFTGNGSVIENGTVVIENGIIKAVGGLNEVKIPHSADIINGSGKWIIPGLINAHVHVIMEPEDPDSNIRVETTQRRSIRAAENLKKYLHSGVTYIRDAGGPGYANIEAEFCLKEGIIEGPGMQTAVRALSITGGHGKQWARICDGREEIRKATREMVAEGADVIKVIASNTDTDEFMFTREEIEMAVEEAGRAGKKTMAHATSLQGIRNAVLAGIGSVEHASRLDDEIISEIIKRNVAIVPTLSASFFSLEYYKQAAYPAEFIREREAAWDKTVESFQKALKAGVRIVFGTDSGTRNNLHDKSPFELVLMVRYGMTPEQAVLSATKHAAELLGIDKDYGTLEAGKKADFILFKENPLDNIEAVLRPVQIYQGGRKIK